MKTHDSRSIANRLIERAYGEDSPFTPLQVIKLVYFCHGWMLGLYERPLIIHPVMAWRYGPVVAEVYHSIKQYGSTPIDEQIYNIEPWNGDEKEEDVIEQVYLKYGQLDGISLSRLTHAPGTPWDHIWNAGANGAVIPNSLIQQHYALLALRHERKPSSS